MKKIALTGGGTGGHIYPCLAVAEALLGLEPGNELFYFGNPDKLEAKLLKSPDLVDASNRSYSSYIEFVAVASEPLPKLSQPLALLPWYLRFRTNTQIAIDKLRDKKIQIVFGTGGYAAGPVFAACQQLKIPYIIHNLDAHMGLANRAFVAGAAALTLGICDLGIKPRNGKVIVTGNPVSRKFLMNIGAATRDDAKLHLLVTGGSQGAESINNAIGNLLPELSKLNIDIVHVTGSKTYQTYIQKYLDNNPSKYPNYKVMDYTHQMPQLCSWADAGVFRAGAMTIAEISASGTVPIFVPLPWAAHDHQNLNAKSLVETGAAISLDQDDKNFEQNLLAVIKRLINNRDQLNQMKALLAQHSKPDSASTLAQLILTME